MLHLPLHFSLVYIGITDGRKLKKYEDRIFSNDMAFSETDWFRVRTSAFQKGNTGS
jgi:hypothetical protein